jgi:radical SAM protein with 4Fe4S-binding SPASM domain
LREKIRIGLKPQPPRWVLIEVTSHCNLSCKMCEREQLDRGLGHMELRDYKKIIDEISKCKTIETVNLQGFGEPLMYPWYIEAVHYGKTRGISDICLNTNGTLLDEKMIKELIKSGIDKISISLDAFSKETYAIVRPNSDFIKVIENIESLIEYKKNHRLQKPHVQLTFVDQKENHHELNDFVAHWIKRVDAIYSQREYHHFRLVDRSTIIERKRIPCLHLWRSLVIYWNGQATVCPMDDNGDLTVGSIYESSMQDIWYGKHFDQIRRFHLKDKYNELVCSNCDYWRGGAAESFINEEVININNRKVFWKRNELYQYWEKAV